MTALVLAACSSSSAVTHSPAPSPATSPAALSCRLPVAWEVQSGQTFTPRAGFLTFPSQAIAEDLGAPKGSRFYDRAFSAWLPVTREAVSSDGSRYAYSEGNSYIRTDGVLHVVDVRTRVDRVISRGGPVYAVLDFAPEGIYVTEAAPEGSAHGLWLTNPATGVMRLISSTIEGAQIGGGAAWGRDYDIADPSPAPGGIEGPRNRVIRLDLKTGAETIWFYRPGTNLYVAGLNPAGYPFVVTGRSNGPDVNTETEELWLVTSPTTATQLVTGTANQQWPYRVSAIDSHGIWFTGNTYKTSPGTVWLYAGGAIRVVATVNVDTLLVAGGCI